MNNLARMYEEGLGVTRDLDEALRWYRQAADKGHEGARKSVVRLSGN